MQTRFPAAVMVLEVLGNEREVIPHHIFPQGLRVTTPDNNTVLEKVVRLCIESVRRRPYMYQRHSAPFQKAKTTEEWMLESPRSNGHLVQN